MPFGLKNAGATYQRAIQTCLVDHWGKRVEAYVDDVVIKTENLENFIKDLQLVFNSLRRYRWKLNPEKCVFGVPAGKLLGFIVSHRGIETYWMYGSSEQIYIQAGRKRFTILQATQESE
jgi:hypothetical protein